MAARFWVGGTGTWDAASTAHWAATSGGAAGASAPTSADDVFIDTNSGTGTITVSGGTVSCKSLDCTGYTGTLTLSSGINVFGVAPTSVCKLAAGMTLNGTTTITLLIQSGTGLCVLTTAGKTIPLLNVVGGATGGWRFADACTVSGTVTLTSGTLDTNGQTCSWGAFSSANTNVRTLTLGASAITITGTTGTPWDTTTFTNLTYTANTAVVTFTAPSITGRFAANTNGLSVVFNGGGVSALGSGGTFRDVTYVGTATKTCIFSLSANTTVTCTGTLTVTGNSPINRVLVQGSVLAAAATLNAATSSLTNVDFQDVIGAGAATWSGTSLGDCGGNSGITFTPSATQTWQGTAGGNWSDLTKWTSRVPLPQDDVVVASAFSASQTITADMPRLGRSIDFTGTTGAPTLALGSTPNTIFGSLTLAAGMSRSGTQNMTFAGRGSYTLTMNGVTFAATWGIVAPGGTYTLGSQLIGASGGTSGTLNVTQGTFDAAPFGAAINNIGVSAGATIKWGSGTWTFPGTSTQPVSVNPSAIVVAGTATIDFTDTTVAKTFVGGSQTYPTLRYRAAGTAGLTITGNNTFAALDLECTTARTVTLPAGGTQTITGVAAVLTMKGAAGQVLSLVSSTPGTATSIVAPSGTLALVDKATVSPSADVTLTIQNKGIHVPLTGAAPSTTYALSAYVRGAAGGTVRIALWDSVSGKQPSSPVMLTSGGQRIAITATTGAGSTGHALLVETDVAQSITFNADGLTAEAVLLDVAHRVFYGFLRRAGWRASSRSCQLYFEDLLFRLQRVYPVIPSTGTTTTGAAIGLVLDAAGWTWPEWRQLSVGDTLDNFSADGSQTARGLLDELIAAERGTIFVRGDGVFVYESRDLVQTRLASWTLATTSDDAPNAVANLEDLESGIDADSVLTRVVVTRTDPGGDIVRTSFDSTAEQAYGRGDIEPLTSPYIPAANVQGLADDLVYAGVRGRPPMTAYAFATTDGTDDELLTNILSTPLQSVLDVDDPFGGTEGEFIVQRAAHTIETGQHRTTYTLTKRAARSFALDSALGGSDVFRY